MNWQLQHSIFLGILALVFVLLFIVLLQMRKNILDFLKMSFQVRKQRLLHEIGMEAYSYAESMFPDLTGAKRLERAMEYFQRQLRINRVPFDYDQARAIIEGAYIRSK